MSLKLDDEVAASVAKAPRVSLADIESQVEFKHTMNGLDLLPRSLQVSKEVATSLGCLTLAVVVLKNGFTVIGSSACASPENYDLALGEKFAYENALRQLWSHFDFCLRQKLEEAKEAGSSHPGFSTRGTA
jgi:Phage protein (N4 Gp49/phage Sf6 gene 66) family